MKTRIKICGITTFEDAGAAVEAGADALGFILFERSPRYVPPDRIREIVSRLPPLVTTVGVFVNESAGRINDIARRCRLHAVQLHGEESPEECDRIDRAVIKACRVRDASWPSAMAPYRVHAWLLDAYTPEKYGGAGKTFDWRLIGNTGHRIILSGGLRPDNVGEAIRRVGPYGVDTNSGVEARPGVKDHGKVRAFIEAVREADHGD